MGSSESDGARQQQSMFKVKGLTLMKEAVNGLVKSSPRKEPTDFPETKLISLTSLNLTSLKSRVVAALAAQGGSPVSGANSRPSTSHASQATDSCAAQGPTRSATAMTAHSEPPPLLKQLKLEREQSPDPRPAQSSPSCPEQTARGNQSLRSRKRYLGAGVSSKSSPHANAASSTYESPATPVYMKVEPLEELPQPQEASLPCHSAEVSPPSSMPKSLPGTSPVKVDPADAPSGMWNIPPKLWEDMQSVLFTHLDST
ncbi:unnamed protein product [Ixodes pacificus]